MSPPHDPGKARKALSAPRKAPSRAPTAHAFATPPAPARAPHLEPGAVVTKDTPAALARSTLVDSLFKDLGQPGTLLVHPHGQSFTLRHDLAEGAAHANHPLMVPLPKGGSVPHTADLALEFENGATIVVDVVDSATRLNDIKSNAFDAFHYKHARKHTHWVLVFVRLPHSTLHQDVVESVAMGYDRVFGVEGDGVQLGSKFAALRTEIEQWVKRLSGGR